MVWWDLYTFSNIKRRHKNTFLQKKLMIQQQLFSEPSTVFDNESLAPCWTKAADTRTKEKKNSSFTFIAANLG